uniref:Uncharacterized protein n=1 Tax=Solibacter usitatus (strain Ellin6076) TaxID=234267 RepID=Q020H9_SOLUE
MTSYTDFSVPERSASVAGQVRLVSKALAGKMMSGCVASHKIRYKMTSPALRTRKPFRIGMDSRRAGGRSRQWRCVGGQANRNGQGSSC